MLGSIPLPEGIVAVCIRRIDGTAHPVFVVAHVAVSHDNRFDIRINEVRVPAIGIGDAIDIIPTTGIEAGKMASQCRPDFHQLEGCLKLLYQHIGFDGSHRKAQVGFKGSEQPVPESGFFSRLNLGQIKDDGRPCRLQVDAVIDNIEGHVNDGGRERLSIQSYMAIIQVQTASPEYFVVKSSCLRQSVMMSRPKNPWVQAFISWATDSATSRNCGSRAMA